MKILKNIINGKLSKKDGLVSKWYWRRNYNKLEFELEQLKEVMASDIYQRVIKEMDGCLELKRYKRENDRLRNKCKVLLEERNSLYDEVKLLKKKGGTIKDGEDEG